MPLSLEARRDRIRRLIGTYATQKAFCDAVEMTESRVSKALSDEYLSDRRLLPIEREIDERKLWKRLDTKEGAREEGPSKAISKKRKPTSGGSERGGDEVSILVRTAVRASAAAAGSGWRLAEGDEHEAERWAVSRQRIYDLIGLWLEPTDECLYIEGWSMKRPGGGLDDGQLVIYRPTDALATGSRYVLQVENLDTCEFQVFCKRVQVLAGGMVRLISDNRSPGFLDEDLLPHNGHLLHALSQARVRLHVVGRVLWPREDDDEREIRLITQAIERLASAGLLKA